MQKMFRGLAAFIAVFLTLGMLASCKGEGYAIKVEDKVVTEGDYKRNVYTLRENYVAALGATETKEFWTDPLEDGNTMSQVFVDYLEDYLVQNKLYALQFDKLGLSFTEEEDQVIQQSLSDMIEAYGSMSAFNQALADGFYTYEEYLEEIYDSAKKSRVLKHYFGEESENPVSVEAIKDYYGKNYARVKFVYISKLDEETGEVAEGKPLGELRQKAEEVLDSAKRESETVTFEDLIGMHSDITSIAEEGMVVSQESGTDPALTEAAMEMKVGEIRLVDSEYAFLIVKRYDGTADEFFTATVQQSALEEFCAEEIAALMEEWRADADIKVNQKIIKKYRPEKLVEE